MTADDPAVDLDLDAIPAALRERDQWVCWREDARDGTPTKLPVEPGTGELASTTNDRTETGPRPEHSDAVPVSPGEHMGFGPESSLSDSSAPETVELGSESGDTPSDDAELLERASEAANGATFQRLWRGAAGGTSTSAWGRVRRLVGNESASQWSAATGRDSRAVSSRWLADAALRKPARRSVQRPAERILGELSGLRSILSIVLHTGRECIMIPLPEEL